MTSSRKVYSMIDNYLSLVDYLHPSDQKIDAIFSDSVRSHSMPLYFTAKSIDLPVSNWRPESNLDKLIKSNWQTFSQTLDREVSESNTLESFHQLKDLLSLNPRSTAYNSHLISESFKNTGLQIVDSEKESTNQIEIRRHELKSLERNLRSFLDACIFEPNSKIREKVEKDLSMIMSRKSGRVLIEKLLELMQKKNISGLRFIESDTFLFYGNFLHQCFHLFYPRKLKSTLIFEIYQKSSPLLISLYNPFNFTNLYHELVHFYHYLKDENLHVLLSQRKALDLRNGSQEEERTIFKENKLLKAFHLPLRRFHVSGIEPSEDPDLKAKWIQALALNGDFLRSQNQIEKGGAEGPYIAPLSVPQILKKREDLGSRSPS